MAANKAYLKYVNDCWDCLPYVKSCLEEAMEFHLSPRFGPTGARLIPHVERDKDRIVGELIDRAGKQETFTVRIKLIPTALDKKVEGKLHPLIFRFNRP